MAQASFDITSLLQQAFGIGRGKPFDPERLNDQAIRQEQGFLYEEDAESNDGEFVQMRQTLRSNLPTGQPVFLPVRIGGVLLPNEPTLIISSRKNIVETPLVGSKRRGTVKELIAIEDWAVIIRGITINYDSKFAYPEDQVKQLRDLYERNESLEVESGLTNLLGIYRLVIREFELPEMIGIQHAQAYQFVCTSDEDFILEL